MKISNLKLILLIFAFSKLQAQNCPEIQLNNLELLSGTNTNLNIGDRLIKRKTIVYNGIAYDAIIEIKEKRIGTGTLAINGTSNLLIRNTLPNSNPYITYNLLFIPSDSPTTGILTPVELPNVSIALADIDGNNIKTFGDIGGYSTTNTGAPAIEVGSNLVNNGFLTGITGTGAAGPVGFNYFRPAVLSTTCPGAINVTNAAQTDLTYGVKMTYAKFTTGDFIFGLTGCGTVSIGERSQTISINAPYSCPQPPTTTSEQKLNNPSKSIVTLNLLEGDLLQDGSPAKVELVKINFIAPTPTSIIDGNTVTVPGEGTWTFDPATTKITFAPISTFTGNPTVLQYSITELVTLKTSNVSTNTITYSSPLPLKLEYLNCKNMDSKIGINWKTAEEVNVAYFELQKGINITDFTTIGKFNINDSHLYNFIDEKPSEGMQYYRLKTYDIDGTITYSKMVGTKFKSTKSFPK
jgi:Surface adhesin CshA repetitive domain